MSAPAWANRSTTGLPNRASQSPSSAESSATWTWIPTPASVAASTSAASVSCERVKDACAPTIPRASGRSPPVVAARKRRFSSSPARARSGPSRSVVS